MKYKILFLMLAVSFIDAIYTQEPAQIQMFSPQGVVKKVRQVTARFSEPMVPFGDPRVVQPFDIDCSEKGQARWVDGKTWSYDFDRDLPAGVVCSFTLREPIKTLSGKEIKGQKTFSFSTGGPAIIASYPYEGSGDVDENQAFILTLDAELNEESILKNVFFSIEGINERVGVKILKGSDRKRILKAHRYKDDQTSRVILQSKQRFPNHSTVRLIWGKGVASLSGVATAEDQALSFKTRGPFEATFGCSRENPKAGCIPVLSMYLKFSAPVSWRVAKGILLRGPQHKIYKASKPSSADQSEGEGGEPTVLGDAFVQRVTFKGPFPEKASLTIDLPKNIKDDAGRSLANLGKFPLSVRTDAYPALAKFSARFGIIELKADAKLPVTLRNLEPDVKARMLKVEQAERGQEKVSADNISPESTKQRNKPVEHLNGNRIRVENEEKVIEWMKKVAEAKRELPILKNEGSVKGFSIPKKGAKVFEVVGIPLKQPGFYVVELESRLLGASLLGQPKPVYVPTAALVTNLSAHFKWGRESSLVWVTTLDNAEPVAGASVSIRDCQGKLLWNGKADKNGIARIKSHLPSEWEAPNCELEIDYREASRTLERVNGGLFVFAKTSDDMTFVHSSWSEGIEPWRFALPQEYSRRRNWIAHTIFDRSLVRAGETIHMKHILRRHGTSGFAAVTDKEKPQSLVIQHQGSEQRYTVPLRWHPNGSADTSWDVPKDTRLGIYEVRLTAEKSQDQYAGELTSGFFRVEEFRVPLMRGIIQPSSEPLIKPKEVDVDISVSYLSGGGASNLPVKLRSEIQDRSLSPFEGFEEFLFANGRVKEGVFKGPDLYESDEDLSEHPADKRKVRLATLSLKLDKTGAIRTKLSSLPEIDLPREALTELEFKDPNGEIQTVSTKVPLWPSKVLVGIKPDSWALSKEAVTCRVAVVDLFGKPVSDADVTVELFQRKTYSHRKRLVGGFYSYEHVTEVKRIGSFCEGRTDSRGTLTCTHPTSQSGSVLLQATSQDDSGNVSTANQEVWIAGTEDWWFEAGNNDRIDLLPEKKRYSSGETATFQARMPFREATALITIEREGIVEAFVRRLSGKQPVIEIPIKETYAPNVFVSALLVRGRVAGTQPTARIDLGKPAYKLGISEINVGWKAHELKVGVSTTKSVYKTREKANVTVQVRRADGNLPPKESEVAIAAVDEGLLELMPNNSWKLLDAMMTRRAYEVKTATAQMQVVGKRHYGLKALPQGGGGGKQITRELFDTLLFWKARVPLNRNGEAFVEIPLNDSLSGFRIVAVATGGVGLFGTGQTSIKTSQDLMILSGIPLLVREGDQFKAGFTLRNASSRNMTLEAQGITKSNKEKRELAAMRVSLGAGEAKEIGWEIRAPYDVETLSYEITAKERDGTAYDNLRVVQKVAEAVPARVFQATLTQIENRFETVIEKPKDALVSKGGIHLAFRPKLSNGLQGIEEYMRGYPYTCMEQKVSKAIALRDQTLWKRVISELPSHMDSDGLVKYFPRMNLGSEVLTSYILSIGNEANYEMTPDIKNHMLEGLKNFVEGRVIRHSALPTADLSIRKMAALEALSRHGMGDAKLLSSISIEPNLWPTSAVIDWINVLLRVKSIPDRDSKLKEAEQILRSRLNYQGTTMGFSTEGADHLWWLMCSSDLNAVRVLLTFLSSERWKDEMPKLVRGVLGRLKEGRWDTTVANAWGVLAMERFSETFEPTPVTGTTSLVNDKANTIDWSQSPDGRNILLGWPNGQKKLTITHRGNGKPWATIQSLAAIPLKEPFSSGYQIKKTLIPIEQKAKGKWSRGDVIRVRLELEAQADMTWVVVNDPIPAGSSILAMGLGRDAELLTSTEESKGWVWPAFQERSFEAFRAYYEYVPKGKWTVEYTLRLNNQGLFQLPATRVEALYAPEMLGEIPNQNVTVSP